MVSDQHKREGRVMAERTAKEQFVIDQLDDARRRFDKALSRRQSVWRRRYDFEDDVELERAKLARSKAQKEYDDLVAEKVFPDAGDE